jgi:hypothetical protein
MLTLPLIAPTPRNQITLRIATWLGLAAAPSFAAMAIITTLLGSDRMGVICGLEPAFLGGMVPMYLLMSVFHSAPWLKLIGERWGHERRISSM